MEEYPAGQRIRVRVQGCGELWIDVGEGERTKKSGKLHRVDGIVELLIGAHIHCNESKLEKPQPHLLNR